jgi:parallel beta-helix repeat protein
MKRNIFHRRATGFFIPLIIMALWLCGASWAYSADYFVDQGHSKANDVNSGSREFPLKTLAAAAAKAKAGDTILIAAGTYRETILLSQSGASAKRPITFRALLGSMVTIKGSDPVSGWAPHNSEIWKKTGWEINSQQVFVDGLPLQQIGETCPLSLQRFEKKPLLPPVGEGLKDMRPGTFFYNHKEETLFIRLKDDADPNGRSVEVSVRDFIIPPRELNHINLERLHFSHSNSSSGPVNGMVNVWGNFWTITDCTFDYADFAGISIIGEGHKITNCKFNNNGNLGISINGSDDAHKWAPVPNRPPQNIILTGNETSYNNYRKFELSWQHGGIKAAVSCNGVTVTNHKALANYGVGIWFDIYCRDITISRSTVAKNLAGIVYEISDQATITNNLVTGNEYHGIYVDASSKVTVMNNTLDDNGFGIVVHGLPRPDHPSLDSNRVLNNIISESRLVDLVLYRNGTTATGNLSDYNLFSRRDKGVKISWTENKGYGVTHTSLRAFATASGQETHSFTADPMWVNREAGNYALKPASSALGAGTEEGAVPGKGTRPWSNSSDGKREGGKASLNIGAF